MTRGGLVWTTVATTVCRDGHGVEGARVFPASDLVHPFEVAAYVTLPSLNAPGSTPSVIAGSIDGRTLDRPDVSASLEHVCAFFGIAKPRLYVSASPGHAHAPGAVRIAERSLVELAPDELEALLAHVCGHLVLPAPAGELSADRAAALFQGNPDAITRLIFAESRREAQHGEEPATRTSRGWTVHSAPSTDDLVVRVREIQAWTATPGFARMAART